MHTDASPKKSQPEKCIALQMNTFKGKFVALKQKALMSVDAGITPSVSFSLIKLMFCNLHINLNVVVPAAIFARFHSTVTYLICKSNALPSPVFPQSFCTRMVH